MGGTRGGGGHITRLGGTYPPCPHIVTPLTSKQEVVGSNPARVACEVFSQTLGKHCEYAVLYTRRCRAELNQLFITRPMNINTFTY